MYVSSKIVDALVQSKIHTENLAEKRSNLKEKLSSIPKAKIIDENKPGILSHLHHSQSTEQDEVNQDEMEYDETAFMSDRDDLADDDKLTMDKLDLLETNFMRKSREFNQT